jgi:hypothetical protein
MIVMSEEKVLMAVSVSSIHRASDARFMAATLRADSTTKGASFSNFETAMFSGHSLVPFETLRDYGFTVVEAPDDWRYDYQKSWQETVIRQAIEQASAFQSHYQRRDMTGGYDKQLAEEVLEVMNKTYPQLTNLLQLKHQLGKEPSDEALSTVLSALKGDGFIDGATQHAPAKLNPLVRITLTKEGRKHLEDEMKKKITKTKQGFGISDASKFILTQLLSEFRQQKLSIDDLRNTYKGLSPKELKERCVAEGIGEVDFDLAMSDLENHDLVNTGPQVLYDNPPNSSVTIIGFYSKKEYSYLTVDGYKEATKAASITPAVPRPSASPYHPVIHGDQIINYGQAGALGRYSTGTINYQQQWAEIESQINLHALAIELGQLRTRLQQTAASRSDFQQIGLLAEAEEHAEKQEGSKVLETLSKVGKGVLDFAKEVGTDLTAKVIAKSVGLEP